MSDTLDTISGSGSGEAGTVGAVVDFMFREPDPDERLPFRRVLLTTDDEQYVAMCLLPADGPLGLEKHAGTTQTFYFLHGRGSYQMASPKKKKKQQPPKTGLVWQSVSPGTRVEVPPDTWHDVRADTGTDRLILLSIYRPPLHPPNLVQWRRPMARERGDATSVVVGRIWSGGPALLLCSVCNERPAYAARPCGHDPRTSTGLQRPQLNPLDANFGYVEFLCRTCAPQ